MLLPNALRQDFESLLVRPLEKKSSLLARLRQLEDDSLPPQAQNTIWLAIRLLSETNFRSSPLYLRLIHSGCQLVLQGNSEWSDLEQCMTYAAHSARRFELIREWKKRQSD